MFFNAKNGSGILSKPMKTTLKVDATDIYIKFNNTFYSRVNGKDKILDEAMYQARAQEIAHLIKEFDYSEYCPVPKNVYIEFDRSAEDTKVDEVVEANKREILCAQDPRWTFTKVYLPEETKKEIDTLLLIEENKALLYDDWKLFEGTTGRAIALNFFGPPGTGKSMVGEAIAGYLGRKVYKINYAQLESKFVGETPKNLKYIFDEAHKENAVIIFDEADSFLGKRLTNISQSADYGVNITRSVMLLELEKFDGIVIFTTNLIDNYDEAFKRRIMANIEFKLPDEVGRNKIFSIYLNDRLPLAKEITSESLARRYDGISGADIKDIVFRAALSALYRDKETPVILLEDMDEAYAHVKMKYKED